MKYLIYILLILAFGLLIVNLFQMDYANPFDHKSSIALIGIVSSLCVIVLMLILSISRKIKEKAKEQEN